MTTGSPTVTKLKELLFDHEAQRLDDLQRQVRTLAETETARHEGIVSRQSELSGRIDAVFERAGTEDRLKRSVATVLDGAFREAEVARHEQLSQAVAPVVVKTIKHELRNSQDEMVDALYPLTGKLVKEYVRAAMADLVADLNRKLGGTNPSDLEKRAKALNMTVGELALAEAQELRVDELFLVRKGSGELVAHWERSEADSPQVERRSGSNRDALIAGYLTGITQFSEEAFDDKKGSLRTIETNGAKIFVRGSPAFLLAARCSGRAPAVVEQVVDDAFLDVLASYRTALADGKPDAGAAVEKLLPDIAHTCEQRFASARDDLGRRAAEVNPAGTGRLKVMAALVLLPLAAWIGWAAWQSWMTARVRHAALEVVGGFGELTGYPVAVDVARGGQSLALAGLMPTAAIRDRVVAAVTSAVPGTAVTSRVAILPQGGSDAAADIAALRQTLAATRSEVQAVDARTSAIGRTLETELPALRGQVAPLPQQATALQTSTERLQAEARRLEAALAALSARVDGLRIPDVPQLSPRDQLAAFVRDNAVFFASGTDFLDEGRTNGVLDRLAALVEAEGGALRIVGYTDERGSSGANTTLAQARAERVAAALADRGVARGKLLAIGRVTALDISRVAGVGTPNRRVTFELVFADEPTGR